VMPAPVARAQFLLCACNIAHCNSFRLANLAVRYQPSFAVYGFP